MVTCIKEVLGGHGASIRVGLYMESEGVFSDVQSSICQ